MVIGHGRLDPNCHAAPTTRPPPEGARRAAASAQRAAALAGWVAAHVLLLALSGGHLPFHASSLTEPPTVSAVLRTDAMLLEVAVLMVVVHLLTRRRTVPDLAARAPATPRARAETVAVLGYGILASAGGACSAPHWAGTPSVSTSRTWSSAPTGPWCQPKRCAGPATT